MSSQTPPPCPTEDELERVVHGATADAGLAGHLSGCPACRAYVAKAEQDDGFLRELKPFLLPKGGGDRIVLPRPAAELAVAVPGYELLGEVHRGGQGVVYRGTQTSTRRSVALKMLLHGAFASHRQRQRFEREIELVATLQHPNIVTLYDSGVTPAGQPYFVMEFIEGVRLDTWIADRRLQTLDTDGWRQGQVAGLRGTGSQICNVLRLFAKVCGAVSYAHQHGVIHRDLKPANVLVDTAGAPHVLDFGLAKLTEDAGDQAFTVAAGGLQTMTGEFIGTAAFAAPEQASGQPDQIDVRTDVYALGLILYYLLTGQLPYPTTGPLRDVLQHITSTAPKPPSAWRAEVDSELDTILLKALAKDRERRYQSAAALLADIDHYLADEPIDAKRDSTWYILRKAAKRHRRLIGAATAAAFALALGLGAVLYSAWDARTAWAREQAERTRAASEVAKSEAVTQILREVIPLSAESFVPEESPARRALDNLIIKLEAGLLENQPDVEAAVRHMLSDIYRQRGVLPVAEVEDRHALRLQYDAFGQDHPEVASSLNDLAEVLLERNSLTEAEERCRRGLVIRRKLFGDVHAEVADSLDTLSRILFRRDVLPEAEQHCRVALRMRTSLLGDKHVDLAQTLSSLASILQQQGNSVAALDACQRGLAIRFAQLSDEHASVISSIRHLATLVMPSDPATADRSQSLTRLADALGGADPLLKTEQTWSTLLDLKQDLLGPGHPDVARTLVDLGRTQNSRGDRNGARATFAEALRIYRAAHGDMHLVVAECLGHFLLTLSIPDDCPIAISGCAERADIYRRASARNEFLAVAAAVYERELADYLSACRDFATAEIHYQEALRLIERALGGPENREVAWFTLIYASMLARSGRYVEAEATVDRACAVWERIAPLPPGPRRSLAQWTLGVALAGQGKFAEAEPLLLESCPRLVETSNEDHDWYRPIIDAYEFSGSHEQAAHWRTIAENTQRSQP